GLITTKILQAQEKNIRLSIEVPEPIEKIDMPIINLSRIIGILLDNAIEASEKIEDDRLIRIAFIKNEDDSVMFIIMNKCKPDMPRVHTLFQENYSTKGKNRGLGLSNLKEITDATSNVLLDTTIDNNYFIQKVEILNSNSYGCINMKIFICEDDVRQRENIVSIINNYIMIEEKPMEIEVATSDPYEVLERAKELKDIGCYFLDIQLEADINGIKLASEIRKYDPVS